MPTLYVENIPSDLYAALRKQARLKRSSIASEVVSILNHAVPTESALRARKDFYRKIKAWRARKPVSKGPFQSTEEMLREDRAR